MDTQLFLLVNSLAGKWPILDSFGRALTGMLAVFVGIVIGIWLLERKTFTRNFYLGAVSAIASRGIIVELLKRMADRPRPFEVLHVNQLIADQGFSFPSGHAAIFFTFAFAFWGTKWFWPLFILALLGSLARVFVGIHYPSDILVGAVIALLVVWVLRKTLFKKQFLG